MKLLERIPAHPSVRTRILILFVMVAALGVISFQVTAEVFPSDGEYSLLFQSGLFVAVFCSLVLEDKFTKPADAFVNATFVLVSLIPFLSTAMDLWLGLLLFYSFLVLVFAVMNMFLLSWNSDNAVRAFVCERTFKLASTMGKSKLIHTFLFLYAVHVVYEVHNQYSVLLLLFWAIHLAMWPLKIPHILEGLIARKGGITSVGRIIRVEVPNVLKVDIEHQHEWSGELIATLGDGNSRRIMPLYKQLQGGDVVGTALIGSTVETRVSGTNKGEVYSLTSSVEPTHNLLTPVGIVCEGSRIGMIRFETWTPDSLKEGQLLYWEANESTVYYQVVDAVTKEEAFERNRHGFQVVEAHQLGTLHGCEGFKKYAWLPEINAPIFAASCNIPSVAPRLGRSDMTLGNVPGTAVKVICCADDAVSHHTAILGVTGSGKTELAFRFIRKAVESDVKVICVDITDQYSDRLRSLEPVELSIDDELANALGQKLHDVETGSYGAGAEKNELKKFTDRLRRDIDCRVSSFLEEDHGLGIFTLSSISNTKATILATEIYLTSLFKYNRQHINGRKRILIVLEEAHTVVPEANTMGLGDYDSRGMVAKIAQIALQGRKYEIGLLVIAQRTATVSKTVLTQCNTVISFSSFDKTGIEFLSNVYGAEHSSLLPNLPSFHALAFGKAIKSERPVIVEMPPLSVSESREPASSCIHKQNTSKCTSNPN